MVAFKFRSEEKADGLQMSERNYIKVGAPPLIHLSR